MPSRLVERGAGQVDCDSGFDWWLAYEFDLRGDGTWQLLLNAARAVATVLASGKLTGITPNTWQAISLAATGDQLTASVDGTAVAQETNSADATGLAGIESNWTRVQFNGLTVG